MLMVLVVVSVVRDAVDGGVNSQRCLELLLVRVGVLMRSIF